MAAYTVEDAAKLQATELKLVHKKLCALPAGLSNLQYLRSLDASDNPQLQLQDQQDQQLPPGITALVLTGCSLPAVPQCLSRLTGLCELQLAANSITQADAIFACPGLLHAGLSFNHISSINTTSTAARNRISTVGHTTSTAGPAAAIQQSKGSTSVPKSSTAACKRTAGSSSSQATAASISCKGSNGTVSTTTSAITCYTNHSSSSGSRPASIAACTSCSSPLMSLDLSHNDITELTAVLSQLQQLTALRSLSLKGNPASLAAGYREAVLQALPQLLYLDGQKLDGISLAAPGSRPGTTSSRRRPGSAKPATADAKAVQVQPVVATSGSTLSSTAVQERTVPLLLRLELGRRQLTELSEHAFATVAAESTHKQQQLLQEAAAAANCCSNDGSTGGSSTADKGSSNVPSGQTPLAEKRPAKAVSNAAPPVEAHTAALAASSSDAACFITAAPLKPIAYHVELQGPDGAQICSTALVIQAPAAADADTATPAAAATSADSKKAAAKGKPGSQDSKAAGSAAAKPRPGSPVKGAAGKARSAADEGAASAAGGAAGQQLQGVMQVVLQLPLSVAGRDYLRCGFVVKLVSTHCEPCALLQPPPAAEAPASAAPAAAGKRAPSAKPVTGASSKPGKTAAAPFVPDANALPAAAATWQYKMKQQVLGTAQLAAADLVECCGEQQTSEGSIQFVPPAPLFSTSTGTLLSLKEASHKQKPIGSCSYKLVLHHQATAG